MSDIRFVFNGEEVRLAAERVEGGWRMTLHGNRVYIVRDIETGPASIRFEATAMADGSASALPAAIPSAEGPASMRLAENAIADGPTSVSTASTSNAADPAADGIAAPAIACGPVPGTEQRFDIPYVARGGTVEIAWRGRTYTFAPWRGAHTASHAAATTGEVVAPTGGVVVAVFISEGQEVEAGQQIAVIEAMKVMTTVEAPRTGTVTQLAVERGQRIEQGAKIAHVGPPEVTAPPQDQA